LDKLTAKIFVDNINSNLPIDLTGKFIIDENICQ